LKSRRKRNRFRAHKSVLLEQICSLIFSGECAPFRKGCVCHARRRQSGFLLNSSNDRRVVGGTSTRSDTSGRQIQNTRHWPVGYLFINLPKPRPGNSLDSICCGMIFRLAFFTPGTRLALELDGCVPSANSPFKRMLAAGRQRPRIGVMLLTYPRIPSSKSLHLLKTLQETKVTAWQKN
jgi:hypothetical protein